MKIKYAFWGILIVFPSFMYSQKVECNESDFTDKSVYKKTKSALTVANNEFIKDYPEAYRIALEKYLFAYNNCSNNALLNYRIGVCYQKIDSMTKSLDYWINSYNLDSTISKDIHYFLGIAYQKNFKFQEAIAEFSKYKIAVKKSEMDKGVYLDILKRENNCKSAMIIDTVNVRIKNLGQNINSEYSDYNLYVIQDTIYFTSRRKSKYNRLDFDGKYFERIFFSYKENGCWTKSQLFDTNRLSTIDFHMAVAGFDTVRNNYIVFESQNNFGLLYYASFSNRKIILHDTLPLFNDADYYYKEVCFDYKNLKNYVLMRPLNILGSDYYYFNIQNSKWSEPINVGYNINSQYNEEGIFISSDGNTLYFASQGHNSIGGYDIFKSTLDSNNNWSKPINLGYPINTIWDDLYYFESKDGSKAYFTSDRPGGLGGYDLYEFDK